MLGDDVLVEGGPPWLSPVAIAMGILALALCASLAAVYLANETEGALREDFRRRALLAGSVVVALAALLLPLLQAQAPHLLRGLLRARTLPVLIVGALCAVVAGIALLRERYRLARAATVGEAACVVAGWALAQYPFIIYPDVTVMNAAAPRATLEFILITLPIGLSLLLPSLWLLFRVFKGEYLRMAD